MTVTSTTIQASDAKQVRSLFYADIYVFHLSPKLGIELLIRHGFFALASAADADKMASLLAAAPGELDFEELPGPMIEAIARFLLREPALDRHRVGGYIAGRDTHSNRVREAFCMHFPMQGLNLEAAFRKFLTSANFTVTGLEAQAISRILESFSEAYCQQNPGVFLLSDTAFILAFALLMLNTDAHSPQLKASRSRRMTCSEFVDNCRRSLRPQLQPLARLAPEAAAIATGRSAVAAAAAADAANPAPDMAPSQDPEITGPAAGTPADALQQEQHHGDEDAAAPDVGFRSMSGSDTTPGSDSDSEYSSSDSSIDGHSPEHDGYLTRTTERTRSTSAQDIDHVLRLAGSTSSFSLGSIDSVGGFTSTGSELLASDGGHLSCSSFGGSQASLASAQDIDRVLNLVSVGNSMAAGAANARLSSSSVAGISDGEPLSPASSLLGLSAGGGGRGTGASAEGAAASASSAAEHAALAAAKQLSPALTATALAGDLAADASPLGGDSYPGSPRAPSPSPSSSSQRDIDHVMALVASTDSLAGQVGVPALGQLSPLETGDDMPCRHPSSFDIDALLSIGASLTDSALVPLDGTIGQEELDSSPTAAPPRKTMASMSGGTPVMSSCGGGRRFSSPVASSSRKKQSKKNSLGQPIAGEHLHQTHSKSLSGLDALGNEEASPGRKFVPPPQPVTTAAPVEVTDSALRKMYTSIVSNEIRLSGGSSSSSAISALATATGIPSLNTPERRLIYSFSNVLLMLDTASQQLPSSYSIYLFNDSILLQKQGKHGEAEVVDPSPGSDTGPGASQSNVAPPFKPADILYGRRAASTGQIHIPPTPSGGSLEPGEAPASPSAAQSFSFSFIWISLSCLRVGSLASTQPIVELVVPPRGGGTGSGSTADTGTSSARRLVILFSSPTADGPAGSGASSASGSEGAGSRGFSSAGAGGSPGSPTQSVPATSSGSAGGGGGGPASSSGSPAGGASSGGSCIGADAIPSAAAEAFALLLNEQAAMLAFLPTGAQSGLCERICGLSTPDAHYTAPVGKGSANRVKPSHLQHISSRVGSLLHTRSFSATPTVFSSSSSSSSSSASAAAQAADHRAAGGAADPMID
ncbi:hypothetical protein H696_00865 [Fonticula alba]|uniref:SEC7 domain-containing protein n=1 Tax=Fonticula alba TaxID=691883 RepID=A0A058ZG36_FONAL|nr:hypothetical protein H696_00865 [Fonticula alba]KCV73324.1 hypothetical protein H696_00865 [Fonticula alba]|eukprot:XP_009493025.1 hypothetical protein H696_00865 [Fonticula alba]